MKKTSDIIMIVGDICIMLIALYRLETGSGTFRDVITVFFTVIVGGLLVADTICRN